MPIGYAPWRLEDGQGREHTAVHSSGVLGKGARPPLYRVQCAHVSAPAYLPGRRAYELGQG